MGGGDCGAAIFGAVTATAVVAVVSEMPRVALRILIAAGTGVVAAAGAWPFVSA